MTDLSRIQGLPARQMAGVMKLPGRAAKRLTGRRAPLHAPDFPLVLLFSEKAGCTSLTKWFLFQIGKLDEAMEFHPWVHRYRRQVLESRFGYDLQGLRLILLRSKPVVKLVRNPYDRAVSSYVSALGTVRADGRAKWSVPLVAAARAHAGKSADRPALSFHDFLSFLAATGAGRETVDKHVARQHVPGEERWIGRIIRLERFADEIRQLEAEYGLASSPLELISSSRHHRIDKQQDSMTAGSAARLELTRAQIDHGNMPSYEAFYSDETRRLVRQCFAADFQAYGYER